MTSGKLRNTFLSVRQQDQWLSGQKRLPQQILKQSWGNLALGDAVGAMNTAAALLEKILAIYEHCIAVTLGINALDFFAWYRSQEQRWETRNPCYWNVHLNLVP